MKRLLLALLILMLLPVAMAEQTSAAPSVCGPLQVIGNQLSDANGNSVQLKGISTHGLSWYPDFVNGDCFRQLRDEWQVNVIRLAMYTDDYNGYCSGGDQEALKALVRLGVECAAAADMYAIVDWHILSDGNPLEHLTEAQAFFDEISRTFAQRNNVLYEICNEPNGGTAWSDVKKYAQEIIPVIRANDPDAVILVGTPNWCQSIGDAAADPIVMYDNILYTVHFYAASHGEGLRGAMLNAAASGLPVFVSEFGVSEASGDGRIDVDEADAWVQAMDAQGISYVAWNLSNKAESSALLRSDCGRVSGFSEGDLSPAGQWLYGMLTGNEASVPAAVAEKESPAADGGMEYTIQVENQWNNNGETYRQYAMTLKNSGAQDQENWRIGVPFDAEIRVSDGWNGRYDWDGETLWISSMDYNGHIGAGESLEGVGFIAAGDGVPAL